ncbi:MAG: flavodoxin family protein [Deltaproteobacteria bacterium]|nr:flavodoxin family protein [Deltaproteobacteria bacterium]
MKLFAINGSPRKKHNTATLVGQALEGAASAGAETELVHLYDLKYTGCVSCFLCKRLDRQRDGICFFQDGLTPLLERIQAADALLIGSPVYFGTETAATRAFMERLCFPCIKYAVDMRSLFPKRIPTAVLYTMNVDEATLQANNYQAHFDKTKMFLELCLGPCEQLLSVDTLQYDDYDKFESEKFDHVAKQKRHAGVFPQDCRAAFELGVRLVSGAR